MELLNEEEVAGIAKQCGFSKIVNWIFEEFEEKIIGYLGDHFNFIIEVESNGIKSNLKLFAKCMPTADVWKAEYIKELLFFKKEYIMLSTLFKEYENREDSHKWRPKSLFIKENIFILENVSLQGYKMPHHQETLTFKELQASIKTLARFHAQSLIFEERKSKELGRTYTIWEQYSDYLQEPRKNNAWRDTGRNAVIDFLKVFSKYKSKPNFIKYLELIIPGLYNSAVELMTPSTEYRNVVVHRDLWTNNIFLKKEPSGDYHAMFVDFQTVIYCSPMLDLSSLIYFNTSRSSRDKWTNEFINLYYRVLSEELKASGIHLEEIMDKSTMKEAYEKSIVFGITQAGIITPIVAMSKEKREEIFCNSETSRVANVVSRSEEFINIAKEDDKYRTRITELFDEIVERYVFPEDTDIKFA